MNPPNYLHELFSANNLPSLLLFFAGLGAIAVGVYTLRDIRTQTRLLGEYVAATKDGVEATHKSADAALLNAQAVINAERPWVMIQIQEAAVEQGRVGIYEKKSLRSFQFSIFNYGKTPAHVTSCEGPKIELCEAPDKDLPIPPDYGTSEWNRIFLAPNDSIPIGECIYPSDIMLNKIIEAASRGEKAQSELVIYGLIEYSDGVSDVTYRTAYCYRHERGALSTMGGHMVLCGPSTYNEYS
jgi:hypothetical protein